MKACYKFHGEDLDILLNLTEKKRQIESEIDQKRKETYEKANLPVNKICFLYYKERFCDGTLNNVMLAYLYRWSWEPYGYDGMMVPRFQYIGKDGKPGNDVGSEYNNINSEFELFDGTIEEARKILKDVKKSITQDKKKKLDSMSKPKEALDVWEI